MPSRELNSKTFSKAFFSKLGINKIKVNSTMKLFRNFATV